MQLSYYIIMSANCSQILNLISFHGPYPRNLPCVLMVKYMQSVPAQYFKSNIMKSVIDSVLFPVCVWPIYYLVCLPIVSESCNRQQERRRNLSTERKGHMLSGVTCRAVSCVIWFCKSALQLNDPGHTHA